MRYAVYAGNGRFHQSETDFDKALRALLRLVLEAEVTIGYAAIVPILPPVDSRKKQKKSKRRVRESKGNGVQQQKARRESNPRAFANLFSKIILKRLVQ